MQSQQQPFLTMKNMMFVLNELELALDPSLVPGMNVRMLVANTMRDMDSEPAFRHLPLAAQNAAVVENVVNFAKELRRQRRAQETARQEQAPVLHGQSFQGTGANSNDLRLDHRQAMQNTRAMQQPDYDNMPAVHREYQQEFAPLPPPVRHFPEPEKVSEASRESLEAAMQQRDLELPKPQPHSVESDVTLKQPWAKPAMGTTDVDLSIDGFSRDTNLHPTRFYFQHTCGSNVRNVSRLEATGIQIPVTAGDVDMVNSAPYLLLQIDEYSAAFDEGATSATRRAFCKFIHHRTYGFPGGRSYVHMVPLGGGIRDFNPPLSLMGKLTISVRRPDGDLISEARDSHRIQALYLNTDAMANWILRTEALWKLDFEAGDVVILSEVSTGNQRVDRFLQRPSGHRVVAAGAYLDNLMQRNTLVIARPYHEDPVTKMWVPDDDVQNDLISVSGELATPAKIVNTSLQVSVSLVARCEQSVRHETTDARV